MGLLLISRLRDRVDAMEAAGLDASLFAHYDKSVYSLEPDEFVDEFLVERCGAREVVVGEDFRFGRGNVGTILRTLDAFEADGLVLLPGCADPFSPKTVRSSMGAVFRRPVWTCTVETFAQVLRGSGLRLLGAALRDATVDARAADYTRAVLAIGSEGRGLSDEVLALCDETVRIPMSPRCESLNAAVAASVLLWEAYR